MAGNAAFGTTLSIGGNLVGELANISGPSITADSIDVSSHDSSDAYREFVAGMLNGGEVTLEGNLANLTVYTRVVGAMEARAEDACVITFPNPPNLKWEFQGIVTAFSTGAPHEDKISYTATIKVTGKPVLSAV